MSAEAMPADTSPTVTAGTNYRPQVARVPAAVIDLSWADQSIYAHPLAEWTAAVVTQHDTEHDIPEETQ